MKFGKSSSLVCAALLVVVVFLHFLGKASARPQQNDSLLFPEERKHLKNARQLTFGGQNAEAYFSADGKRLYSGSDDSTIKVWDLDTGKEALTLRRHTHARTYARRRQACRRRGARMPADAVTRPAGDGKPHPPLP